MEQFDFIMVALVVACLGFASWLVMTIQRIKMLEYSMRNVEAAYASVLSKLKKLGQ